MATLYTDLAPHTKLFEEIMEWGEEQEEKINWAWQSPGGWEGWAQVELHFLFPDTTREDRAYRMPDGKTPFRTDLALKEGEYLMGSYSSDPVQERVLLELKCEGAKNRGNFKANVQKDLIKIQLDFKDEWWKPGSCSVYSIALSMSDAGDSDLRNLGMANFTSDEDYNPPFRLWWAMRYIAADHLSNPNLTDEQKIAFTKKDQRYPVGPLDYDPSDSDSEPETSDHHDEANSEVPNEYYQAEVGDPFPYNQDDHHYADDDNAMSEDEIDDDRDNPADFSSTEDAYQSRLIYENY